MGQRAPGAMQLEEASLQSELEDELIRGVPLSTALGGWARHWANKGSGMFQADQSSWDLSQPTKTFDIFISHDWSTSRWEKLLAMLLAFNARAAALATVLVSGSQAVLVPAAGMQTAVSMLLPGNVTFWFVLCFWQRCRQLAGKCQIVFFDKLCIAQHDENLKIRSVYGLASFLNHSEGLLILWSSRYFSRLWTAFELIAYTKDDAVRPIQMLPTKSAVLYILMALSCSLLGFVGASASSTGDRVSDFFLVAAIAGAAALCLLGCSLYIGIALMKEVSELPRQLASFSIQQTLCWCCSNGHSHPVSGKAIPCDRVLVCRSLQKWYRSCRSQSGHRSGVSEEHIEYFNLVVRNRLSTVVLESMGGMVRVELVFYLVCCSSGMPYLAYWLPEYVAGARNFAGYERFVWWARCFSHWVSFPTCSLFAMKVYWHFCWLGFQAQCCCGCYSNLGRSVIAALLVGPCTLLCLLPLLTIDWVRTVTYTPSLAPIFPLLGTPALRSHEQ